MFSLWAKERWLRDGFCFSSNRVSRCLDLGIRSSLRSSVARCKFKIQDKKKVTGYRFRVASFKIQDTKYNVQDVNLSRLYYTRGRNASLVQGAGIFS